MFKRIRWIGVGALAGVGASVWTQRKARVVAARYRPAGLAGAAAGRAREWPNRVRAAVVEGRQVMHEREAELRGRLGPLEPVEPTEPSRRPERLRPRLAIDAASVPGRPLHRLDRLDRPAASRHRPGGK
jgi:hypothetical protein